MGTADQLTRRTLLSRAGAAVAAYGSASLIAACGGGATTVASRTTAKLSKKELGARLRSILNLPTGKQALAGQRIDLGLALELDGDEAPGTSQYNGIELALSHILAAGGPTIFLHPRHLSDGNEVEARTAIRIFGEAGVPICLVGPNADYGAMLDGTNRQGILLLNGTSGIADALQGEPFLYGLVANQPGDLFGGGFEVMKHRINSTGSTALVTATSNPAQLHEERRVYQESSALATVPIKGFNRVSPQQTDYTATLKALESQKPSVILLNLGPSETTAFLQQLESWGSHPPAIGFSWDPGTAELPESGYEGFAFVGEYPNLPGAQSDWEKLFVSEYRSGHGIEPDRFAASAYEDTFLVWDLARRIHATGGNLGSGRDFQAVLEANPSFKSLYGEGGKAGVCVLDPNRHVPVNRTLGAFEAQPGSPAKRFATVNIGGSAYLEEPS